MEKQSAVVMDPPSNGRIDWTAVAAMARANPGKWCRVARPMNPTVAVHIRRGSYPKVPPTEFEVTTRRFEGNIKQSWIFVRTRG